MRKLVEIKIFNDILDQLFDHLEINFPLFKSDLILTRTSTELLRKCNPRLVIEQFMTFIIPYKQHIFTCNEDFFLQFDVGNLKNVSSGNIIASMKIKNMWTSSQITDEQKAYIWMYFQKLIKAGEQVMCS
jgi:hypothetical protein